MSFVTAAAVGGLALTGYGAYQGDRASRRAAGAQRDALAAARTQLSPFDFAGPGGQRVQYGPGGMSLMLGDNAGMFEMLRQYGERQLPAMGGGLSPEILQARQGVLSNMGGPNLGLGGAFSDLERMAGGAGDASYQQLLQNMSGGFQRPLQNTAFRGAGQQLQEAMMGGEQARSRTLDLLRQQAAPFEQRGMQDLQQNLFNTGNMGSTGGGIQMEAFARGLGQADLSRQLAAADEGRAFQNNAFGLASGMSSLGSGLRSQEDQLLQSAFGRFADTSRLGMDLNHERFSRSMYGNELGFNRARDVLGLQTNLAMLPGEMDAQRLGNMGSALQTRQGLQDSLMQLFSGGLSAEQAAANARIGSGSNMAAIAGSPNFGQPDMARAGMWSQIGSSLMGDRGLVGAMQGMFGRHASPVQEIPMYSLPRRI